jgi:UTP:GlnB (protein PII) uridylyltransferase
MLAEHLHSKFVRIFLFSLSFPLIAIVGDRIFSEAEEFLWHVRCHLHYLTCRAEEQLIR